jgi:hypothetical protein
MYACLSRTTPQPANARRQGDAVVPAKRAWAGKYAADLLEVIDWTMQLDHLKRPQSVLALQKALLGEAPNRRTG